VRASYLAQVAVALRVDRGHTVTGGDVGAGVNGEIHRLARSRRAGDERPHSVAPPERHGGYGAVRCLAEREPAVSDSLRPPATALAGAEGKRAQAAALAGPLSLNSPALASGAASDDHPQCFQRFSNDSERGGPQGWRATRPPLLRERSAALDPKSVAGAGRPRGLRRTDVGKGYLTTVGQLIPAGHLKRGPGQLV
jgi:hypothetical protein